MLAVISFFGNFFFFYSSGEKLNSGFDLGSSMTPCLVFQDFVGCARGKVSVPDTQGAASDHHLHRHHGTHPVQETNQFRIFKVWVSTASCAGLGVWGHSGSDTCSLLPTFPPLGELCIVYRVWGSHSSDTCSLLLTFPPLGELFIVLGTQAY